MSVINPPKSKKDLLRVLWGRNIVKIKAQDLILIVHEDLVCGSSIFFKDRLQPNRKSIHDCAICMEKLDEMAAEITFCRAAGGCGHNFHDQCCREWTEEKQTCPMCRSAWVQQLETEIDLSGSSSRAVQEYINWLYTGEDAVQARLRTLSKSNMSDFFLQALYLHDLSIKLRDEKFRARIEKGIALAWAMFTPEGKVWDHVMERRVLEVIDNIYGGHDTPRPFTLPTMEYFIRGMIPCYSSDNFLSLERHPPQFLLDYAFTSAHNREAGPGPADLYPEHLLELDAEDQGPDGSDEEEFVGVPWGAALVDEKEDDWYVASRVPPFTSQYERSYIIVESEDALGWDGKSLW